MKYNVNCFYLQVKRDESNFVYASWKLIVELEDQAHWIWDARSDLHGTTLNRLCASQPGSWKRYAHKHPDKGQWSRANVITKAATAAAKRQVIEVDW